MVDFKKKLGKAKIDKKVDPLEIYNELDRKSITGPLREVQKEILNAWYADLKDKRDLIIKLHTGEGKTLIGLLILLSKINAGDGPCLYICPNKYLFQQTCNEAKKFGINFVIISPDNSLPSEFLSGEKILITYVQKVFHGKTIFGLDNNSTKIQNLILDDAHACVDSIKQSFSIKINSERIAYKKLITLFDDDLRDQGEGSFLEILSGEYSTILGIPYWSWIDKKTEVLKIISEEKNEDYLKFAWPLLKDHMHSCNAFVTGHEIEISLSHIPIKRFGSFHNSKSRILMSATTQDDTFFIKGFEFSIQSIQDPLIQSNKQWSGEKMILIPSLVDESLDKDNVLSNIIKKDDNRKFGIVSISPSFKDSKLYESLGCKIANSNNIIELLSELKNEKYSRAVIIVNRYDGIDLPDDSCRILILDGKPVFDSLSDRYEEICRDSSDLINIKIAQRIEQGLGRSVRGEKDFSVILLLGPDLIKFIKSPLTNKYFSPQTKAQIEIGLQIAGFTIEDKEEGDSALSLLNSLLNQCLSRDDGWKEFYKEQMDKVNSNIETQIDYKIIEKEKLADEYFYNSNFEKASECIQDLLDNYPLSPIDRGWFLQKLAKYRYSISKTESNQMQLSAFNQNYQLMKPRSGITYKKISYINENRAKRISDWIRQFSSFEELIISTESTLGSLSFGVDAEKFEKSLQEVGLILGFLSQRPDKEIKKGPDNLWCGVNDKYIFFECKSEVEEERKEINKGEASQMNTHCGWFEEEYGKEASVLRILIIPTKTLSYYGNFTHDIRILRRGKLRELKTNIKNFLKEFKRYNLNDLTNEKINEFLGFHKLNIDNLLQDYNEKYYKLGS